MGATINRPAQIKRPPMYWVVIAQIGLTLVLSVGLLLLHSRVASYSALMGGTICFVPNAYFVYKAFQYTGPQAMHHMMRAFYVGGSWKLILTATLFGVVFTKIDPLNIYTLFGAFALTQIVGIFVTAKVTTKKPKC